MANALFPSSTGDQSYSQAAHSILDEMILCGNRVAGVRKQELSRIEGLFQELARRVEQEGLRVLTLFNAGPTEVGPENVTSEAQPGDMTATEPGMVLWSSAEDNQPLSADVPAATNIDSLDSIGISSYEFLSIVDQINHPAIPYGDLDVRSDWLAEENIIN